MPLFSIGRNKVTLSNILYSNKNHEDNWLKTECDELDNEYTVFWSAAEETIKTHISTDQKWAVFLQSQHSGFAENC